MLSRLHGKNILQKLHFSHCGIEKCKANARLTVFWPGMTKDIEDMVSSCEKCINYQSKQPPKTHANSRYSTITMADSCIRYIRTQKSTPRYLVVIDYYSKYIEAFRLNGKTSRDVIQCLNEFFSRHGYPQTLVADNMPDNSREMMQYASKCDIHITTISPTNSQSNGLAQKAVHIVKNLLGRECNLNEGLMEYRNTPISNFPYSPNQMAAGKFVQEFLSTL